MPQLTFPVVGAGLAVPVWIGLDGKSTAALRAAGQPIPPPVRARALLDTCSDLTAVAGWVLRKLATPPVNTATTLTAGGNVTVNLYEVSLSIEGPGQSGTFLMTRSDLTVSELSVPLPDADVLIGLDLLLEGKLFLNGPSRQFTLDY